MNLNERPIKPQILWDDMIEIPRRRPRPSAPVVLAWIGAAVIIGSLAYVGHNGSWIAGYGVGLVEGHDIAVYKCRRSIADCTPAQEGN